MILSDNSFDGIDKYATPNDGILSDSEDDSASAASNLSDIHVEYKRTQRLILKMLNSKSNKKILKHGERVPEWKSRTNSQSSDIVSGLKSENGNDGKDKWTEVTSHVDDIHAEFKRTQRLICKMLDSESKKRCRYTPYNKRAKDWKIRTKNQLSGILADEGSENGQSISSLTEAATYAKDIRIKLNRTQTLIRKLLISESKEKRNTSYKYKLTPDERAKEWKARIKELSGLLSDEGSEASYYLSKGLCLPYQDTPGITFSSVSSSDYTSSNGNEFELSSSNSLLLSSTSFTVSSSSYTESSSSLFDFTEDKEEDGAGSKHSGCCVFYNFFEAFQTRRKSNRPPIYVSFPPRNTSQVTSRKQRTNEPTTKCNKVRKLTAYPLNYSCCRKHQPSLLVQSRKNNPKIGMHV